MSPLERRARDHLAALEYLYGNANVCGVDPVPFHTSDDPEVLRLTFGGLAGLRQAFVARVLEERRDEVYLNRCPMCQKLARTPKARQCRHCGFQWHQPH